MSILKAPIAARDAAAELVGAIKGLRRALFMCASHCQGGHSEAGEAAARMLGVPFPITMDALRAKALGEGFDPNELWPWLERQRRRANEPGYAGSCAGE